MAMVFQNYALYPYLDVAANIAFPLKMARVPKAEREQRVRRVAEMLELEEYLARKPSQLSGGQRQRVAMGRAVVREPKASSWTSRCRTSTPSCASRCAPTSPRSSSGSA